MNELKDFVAFMMLEDHSSTLSYLELLNSQIVDAAAADPAVEWICILEPGSVVVEHAVERLAEAIQAEPDVDLFYADERDPYTGDSFVKPDYSPERLRGQDYISGAAFYRTSLVSSVGPVRGDLPGAELYDLTLRAVTAARSVGHIAEILFDRPRLSAPGARDVSPSTRSASVRRALEDHLTATGGGTVESIGESGVHDTRREVQDTPLVSIIIPTRGDVAEIRGTDRCLAVEAVRSVVEKSSYTNVEFVIVIDTVAPQFVTDELQEIGGDRIRFVPWDRPFSFSEKMNLGVLHSRGDFLLFLNDDVEVISTGWIEAMLALAQRPFAGLAGAMLYFEDETIQHAGHAYYRSDVTHIGLNSERGSTGPNDAFLLEREVDGVTAACSMMPRHVFFEVGGFTSLLPGNFNDVDLCMKVAAKGYIAYWTPHAELYHYESKSRDPRVALYEIQTAWGRWEHRFWDSKYWPVDPHTFYARAAG